MFRRALITDEVSQEPEAAVRLALRYGLEGVEVRSVWNKGPHELSHTEVRRLRALLRDAGLATCAVATPCFKCPLDEPRQVRSHFEVQKRCLGLCEALGSPLARIFTFWAPKERGGETIT